uniref:Uncharacterized protein n=1 Tax=Anguilla anguilla TaxID=7936 RepID=A0A0E9TRG6_ANGAN
MSVVSNSLYVRFLN